MNLKRCVRCGRMPHDPEFYPDCPYYVEPASWWRRAANRVLVALTRPRRRGGLDVIEEVPPPRPAPPGIPPDYEG